MKSGLRGASSERSSGWVAAQIRDAIARGRYLAGERLYQEEVAEQLEVSRQPVRQAFERLQAEGVLTEVRPGRLIVSKLSLDEIVENVTLRAMLEPHAAKLAARNATPELIARLREINRKIVEEPSAKENWNYEFHKFIATMAKSKLLAQFIDRLWFGMPNSPMSWSLRQNTASNSAWHHELMIDAIAAHEEDKAEALMREHIEATRDFLMRRQASERLGATAPEVAGHDAPAAATAQTEMS